MGVKHSWLAWRAAQRRIFGVPGGGDVDQDHTGRITVRDVCALEYYEALHAVLVPCS